MKNIFKFYLPAFALVMSLVACGGEKSTSLEDELGDPSLSVNSKKQAKMLDDLIQSIPSPVEMNTVIKSTGAAFNANIMHKTSQVDKYTTNYDQAFNVGVYTADMGYINVYDKTMYSLACISAIKKLSDAIQVGQFFDFEALQRLSKNSNNVDSLQYISINSFNKMDAYLRSQNRGELSVLIVSGAWLEGLHVATQTMKAKSNDELREKIGEQKIVLESLMKILNMCDQIPHFKKIISGYDKLNEVFKKVEIKYIQGEPVTKIIDGQMVIEDSSTSEIIMSDGQLKEITELTEKVRSELLK
ncbi:MAG: hypothetical protein KA264_01905 [Crocinitomicaceae bacterium]|nr:hypothetical protein [Crocinitomicaceae bacterium]